MTSGTTLWGICGHPRRGDGRGVDDSAATMDGCRLCYLLHVERSERHHDVSNERDREEQHDFWAPRWQLANLTPEPMAVPGSFLSADVVAAVESGMFMPSIRPLAKLEFADTGDGTLGGSIGRLSQWQWRIFKQIAAHKGGRVVAALLWATSGSWLSGTSHGTRILDKTVGNAAHGEIEARRQLARFQAAKARSEARQPSTLELTA